MKKGPKINGWRVCVCGLVWLLQASSIGMAQSAGVEDLTGLSIEDLARVRLSTASRHLDDPRKAPASVTVIDREEIRRYGWRTLAELLRSVPGFYTAYDRNYSYVGVRGFLQSGDYNARVLLLVDGHRFNDNVYDSALIGTEFSLDLNLIERVEIVRGPGSSLYGTNAELAIVNVITRRPESKFSLESQADYQTYVGRTGELTASFRNQQLDGIVSASLFRYNGQSPLYFQEFDTPATNHGLAIHIDGDRFDHAFASLRRGSWHLEGLWGSRWKQIPNASYDGLFNDPGSFTVDKRGYVEAAYNHSFASHTDLDFRAYYDAYRYYASYVSAGPGGMGRVAEINHATADWVGTEAVLAHKLGRQHFVAGASAEYDPRVNQQSYYLGQPYLMYDNRSPWLAAVFGEAELNPNSWLTFSLGGRIDWHSSISAAASPRVAVMVLPDAKTTLKYVYSKAFRAPDPYDQYDVDVSFFGSPTLKAEDIHSQTLILDYQFAKWGSASIDGFENSLDSTIEESIDLPTGDTVIVNTQGDRGRGFEFETAAKSESGWSGRASYAYVQTRQKSNGQQAMNSPKNVAKLYATAPLIHQADLGVELLYNGSQTSFTGQHISPSFLANATLSALTLRSGWGFSASCYNLLDRKWSTPTGPEVMAPATVQDGRTYRFQVTYRWSRDARWKAK